MCDHIINTIFRHCYQFGACTTSLTLRHRAKLNFLIMPDTYFIDNLGTKFITICKNTLALSHLAISEQYFSLNWLMDFKEKNFQALLLNATEPSFAIGYAIVELDTHLPQVKSGSTTC